MPAHSATTPSQKPNKTDISSAKVGTCSQKSYSFQDKLGEPKTSSGYGSRFWMDFIKLKTRSLSWWQTRHGQTAGKWAPMCQNAKNCSISIHRTSLGQILIYALQYFGRKPLSWHIRGNTSINRKSILFKVSFILSKNPMRVPGTCRRRSFCSPLFPSPPIGCPVLGS